MKNKEFEYLIKYIEMLDLNIIDWYSFQRLGSFNIKLKLCSFIDDLKTRLAPPYSNDENDV